MSSESLFLASARGHFIARLSRLYPGSTAGGKAKAGNETGNQYAGAIQRSTTSCRYAWKVKNTHRMGSDYPCVGNGKCDLIGLAV